MNIRELALALAQLQPARRRQLLAELPEERRALLEPLIEQARALGARAGAGTFEQVLERMQIESAPQADALSDAAVLSHLLQHESPALRRQVVDVFSGGERGLMTERVRALVGDWLRSRLALSPFEAPPAPKTSWWRRWRHG